MTNCQFFMRASEGHESESDRNKLKFIEREENIEEKREDAGYQHFLFFPQCFLKASSSGS